MAISKFWTDASGETWPGGGGLVALRSLLTLKKSSVNSDFDRMCPLHSLYNRPFRKTLYAPGT